VNNLYRTLIVIAPLLVGAITIRSNSSACWWIKNRISMLFKWA